MKLRSEAPLTRDDPDRVTDYQRERDFNYLELYSTVELWLALVYKGLTQPGILLNYEHNNYAMRLRVRVEVPRTLGVLTVTAKQLKFN